jgi:hypothetical protein
LEPAGRVAVVRATTLRWAGLVTIVFAAALVLEFISGHIVHVWADDMAETLRRVHARRGLYLFHTGLGLLLPLLLTPLTAALATLLGPPARRTMAAIVSWVAIAVVCMMASGLFELRLAGVAAAAARAEGPAHAALVRQGELVDRISVALGTAGWVALAPAILLTGLLILRTGALPRPMGWVAVGSVVISAPGLLGFVAEPLFSFHLAGYAAQVGWLFAAGLYLWRGINYGTQPR